MNPVYLNHFKIKDESLICLTGNDRPAVLQILAAETVKIGRQALIISTENYKYPVEGNVMICEDTGLFRNLMQSVQPQITYIGKKLNGEYLQPFSLQEIDVLAKSIDADTRLFIDLNIADSQYLQSAQFFNGALVICTLNFILFRDDVLHLTQPQESEDASEYDENIILRARAHLDRECPMFNAIKDCREKMLFIGQLRTLLDENILLPIARHVKSTFGIRVFYGNPSHLTIREIG